MAVEQNRCDVSKDSFSLFYSNRNMSPPSSVNLLVVFCLFTGIGSSGVEQVRLRGVQTSFLSLYVPSKPFACLDGSLTIPFEFINDDYCDCRDGSDEPGTSACPNGRFFCENKGHVGSVIPSHLVGDGICDCCDGSDEYERRVTCNNTCFELAQKSRAENEAKRTLHEAGVAKKKEIMANSVAMQSERKTRLNELEQSVEQLQIDLKGKEETKQQAEGPETAAKDKHQKSWEEERARRESIAHDRQLRDFFNDLDLNHDSSISIEELQRHTELDTNTEDEFTEEEARTILGADAVDFAEFNNTVFDQISNSYRKSNTNSDEDSSVATSLDHEKHQYDDTMPEYDEETKKIIQVADQARQEFDEVQKKLDDLQNQIEDLKKQSNVDIGPHGEYAAFIDQCFDYEEREYTYRVCMFKEAKQISKGGGSDVLIGNWDSWVGPSTQKYQRMKYSNGASCWNGPSRSLTVTFQCGTEHRIMDVREPSRCEYAMLFETPSACDELVATGSHPDHSEF